MRYDELHTFLVWCGQNGYANSPEEKRESDGSHTIELQKGDWRFHDNFFGGEPFGGREVVFYKNRPVWMMTYYGLVKPSQLKTTDLYTFLRQALGKVPVELPVRGPKKFEADSLIYENEWEGEINLFHGVEHISCAGGRVYSCRYVGGLIGK